MSVKREDLEALEQDLILAVDWAREMCETELPGQYTSDAALQLALFALADSRRATDAVMLAQAVGRTATLKQVDRVIP